MKLNFKDNDNCDDDIVIATGRGVRVVGGSKRDSIESNVIVRLVVASKGCMYVSMCANIVEH